MKIARIVPLLLFSATLAGTLAPRVQAQQLITNGGFESGLTGWTTADQVGSDGAFALQTGTTSPVNAFTVPAPPQGTQAAMTDSGGPGSHVLYQDFVIPNIANISGVVNFSLFINNGADNFTTPANLDFAADNRTGGQNLNQQARVDLMTALGGQFSVAGADVLQNVFQTKTTDPLTSGYTNFSVDISGALQGRQGQTLRLRFAEVDNVSFLNLGVDRVSLQVSAAPEPSSLPLTALTGCGLLGILWARRRQSDSSE